MPDKVGFRSKTITRNIEHHFLMKRESNNQENMRKLYSFAYSDNFEEHKTKTDRTSRKNRQLHDYSWKFQLPCLDSDRSQ